MTSPTPPPPVNAAGLTPAELHAAVLTALAEFTTWCANNIGGVVGVLLGASNASRMAVLMSHAPDPTRPVNELGGLVMCLAESPGDSRVAWPCAAWLGASAGLVTGLLTS